MKTAPGAETHRTPAAEGLRERKKRETRARIAAKALELFATQGFERTTIAQIAEATDVAPRTVSSYFPVKEELAFPERELFIATLRDALTNREPGVDALAALKEWIRDSDLIWAQNTEEAARRRRIIEAEPALRAYELRTEAAVVDILRAEIARDLDRDENDLEPRMASAAAVAIFEVLSDFFKPSMAVDGDDLEAVRVRFLAQLDRALAFVAAGIAALRETD
jgi:AcrR family transcriptional regulator